MLSSERDTGTGGREKKGSESRIEREKNRELARGCHWRIKGYEQSLQPHSLVPDVAETGKEIIRGEK